MSRQTAIGLGLLLVVGGTVLGLALVALARGAPVHVVVAPLSTWLGPERYSSTLWTVLPVGMLLLFGGRRALRRSCRARLARRWEQLP